MADSADPPAPFPMPKQCHRHNSRHSRVPSITRDSLHSRIWSNTHAGDIAALQVSPYSRTPTLNGFFPHAGHGTPCLRSICAATLRVIASDAPHDSQKVRLTAPCSSYSVPLPTPSAQSSSFSFSVSTPCVQSSASSSPTLRQYTSPQQLALGRSTADATLGKDNKVWP